MDKKVNKNIGEKSHDKGKKSGEISMVLIEDSIRRNQLEHEIWTILMSRAEEYFSTFTPDSTYSQHLTNNRLAKDLLEQVLLRESFIYSLDDEDKVFLVYKGERWDFSTKIKKLIKMALEILGKQPSKHKISETFSLLSLDVAITKEQIKILRRFLLTKNYYLFDMGQGKILPSSYEVIKFFYDLFKDHFKHHRVISSLFREVSEWIRSGDISPNDDLRDVDEIKTLWESLIGSIPFPIKIPAEYDPTAKAPRWEQFLNEVLDKSYHTAIKRYLGYVLYPGVLSNLPFFCVLLGEGSNGKTVFLKAIEAVFGDENISHVPIQNFNRRFDPAAMQNKLLNIAGDLPQKGIYDTGFLKMISGGDVIPLERKYKDIEWGTITAKQIFSTNELPQTSDKTYAFYRRWLIFIFPRTFKEDEADPYLLDKLIKERSGILNWILEGYRELMEYGTFDYPHTVEEIMDMYEYASNSLARFVNEECEEAPGEMILFSDFYQRYVAYCKEHHLTPKADSVVGRNIKLIASYVDKAEKKINGKKRNVLMNIRVNYLLPAERENLIAEAEKKLGPNWDKWEADEVMGGDYLFVKSITISGKSFRAGESIKRGELPNDLIKELLKGKILEEIKGD